MNDLLQLCIERACYYEPKEKMHVFTAACLSEHLMKSSNLIGTIDGQLIRTILTGRPNIVVLGSGYYGLTTIRTNI
jgi:hypothetical protein